MLMFSLSALAFVVQGWEGVPLDGSGSQRFLSEGTAEYCNSLYVPLFTAHGMTIRTCSPEVVNFCDNIQAWKYQLCDGYTVHPCSWDNSLRRGLSLCRSQSAESSACCMTGCAPLTHPIFIRVRPPDACSLPSVPWYSHTSVHIIGILTETDQLQ